MASKKAKARLKLLDNLERLCEGILSGYIKKRYAIMRVRRLSKLAKEAEAMERGDRKRGGKR